jgi:ribose 5-phosphate isomerase B
MIYIGCDHAGYDLKTIIINYLKNKNMECVDLGCDSSNDKVDYPDYAQSLALKIQNDPHAMGILICGSGMGMSISANRFKNVRAALCTHEFQSRLARAHNDANIICLGSRITGVDLSISCVDVFLNTPFEGERHKKRVEKIEVSI